jgi:two-component system nitrogen regulation sensor histidine kinase NtrY
MVLAVGFVIAASMTIAAVLFAISEAARTGAAGPWFQTLLWGSVAISIVLLGVLIARFVRLQRANRATASGGRIHKRFVTLFSLAAIVPAILVAIFLGAVLNRAIEDWFTERVKTLVERGATVGQIYTDGLTLTVQSAVNDMAADLNAARGGLTENASQYQLYLERQAQTRNFVAAYVMNRKGDVLARAEAPQAPPFAAPEPDILKDADAGQTPITVSEQSDVLRAVHRLTAYPDAYLYVTLMTEKGLLTTLRSFSGAVEEYRSALDRSARLKALFLLSYVAAALLVLVAAIWFALHNAARIATPIGRLSQAARRVADGDLSARVPVGLERDEVDALGRAFNGMTGQLETQRNALVSAREEAEDRTRFIQAVLAGVSAGVVGLDGAGRITAANGQAARLLGEGAALPMGRRLVEVAPEFADLLAAPPLAAALPTRIDLARDGATRHLSVRVSRETDAADIVLTFDDMTKLIAAQRQEAWKDVARRIAHEIRNPLTPIQLSAERLRRKYLDQITSDKETFQRCTDTIMRQVSDIGRMVDEFSTFARMPAARIEPSDVSEIAREAVFAQRISHTDIAFDLIGADAPLIVQCDGRLLGQAIGNLLKNAAEAILEKRNRVGEPKQGRVTLSLLRQNDGLVLEVVDNGPGFPVQDRARLTEPYVTTRTRGSGLGLAIVSRVVEDHGGHLELDDAPGAPSGARVRIRMPIGEGAPTLAHFTQDTAQ